MRKEKAIFIFNPSSGLGKIRKNIGYIEKELRKKYHNLEIIESKSEEHFKSVIDDACRTCKYVLFSGGDGTFNMVINSIPDIEELPIFGYLPSGSVCDMAYNTNISKKLKKGMKNFLDSEPKDYNIGSFNDHNFIYVCDYGTFSDMPHQTKQKAKKYFGILAYGFYGIKSLFNTLRIYKIKVDGVEYETPFFCISNSKEVAKSKINKNKSPRDGIYYCAIIKKGFMKGLFNLFYLLFNGVEKAQRKGKIYYFEKESFLIECEDKEFDVDGELHIASYPAKVGYSGRTIKLLMNR